LTDAEKACLNRLFLTDPKQDKDALKRRKGNRTPGTCDWIFDTEEVQMWLGETKATAQCRSNVLWLHGLPGTGKSTMAITLVEELPKKPVFSTSDKTLAYFFLILALRIGKHLLQCYEACSGS
jgi:pantothenate kinase-related protein Tda10